VHIRGMARVGQPRGMGVRRRPAQRPQLKRCLTS
jgi:hypothetical protein